MLTPDIKILLQDRRAINDDANIYWANSKTLVADVKTKIPVRIF